MSNHPLQKIAWIICMAVLPSLAQIGFQNPLQYVPPDTVKSTKNNPDTAGLSNPAYVLAVSGAVGGMILGAGLLVAGLAENIGADAGKALTVGLICGLSKSDTGSCATGNISSAPNPGTPMLIIGTVLMVGSAIYGSVVTAMHTREKAQARSASHFNLYPTLAQNSDGSQRVGMMARMSF